MESIKIKTSHRDYLVFQEVEASGTCIQDIVENNRVLACSEICEICLKEIKQAVLKLEADNKYVKWQEPNGIFFYGTRHLSALKKPEAKKAIEEMRKYGLDIIIE